VRILARACGARPGRRYGGGCVQGPSGPGRCREDRVAGAEDEDCGCELGASPDRRCSPGAYYSKLTVAVVCSASFHTGDVRYVPDSEKHAVEVEYGMAPKKYGSTLEIDTWATTPRTS
jgi:hypothetical protein